MTWRNLDRFLGGEERWQGIAWVNELLLVCQTWTQEDAVRIVSARRASREKRNRYWRYQSWPSSVMRENLATRSHAGRRET